MGMVGTDSWPLVTIGMPIRNGMPMLAEAFRAVLAQDYPNFEIIVSDNGSTDATSTLLADFAKKDARICITRQVNLLTALDNFQWVLKRARGEFFLWGAHDDLRDPDYVSRLVAHLRVHPTAVLAFGELRVSSTFGEGYHVKSFVYETKGLSPLARVRKTAHRQCYHIYGVWRTAVLQQIPFIFNPWWPDLPLMIAAAYCGEYHCVPGVRFDYLEMPKTNLERAQYQDNTASFSRVARTIKLFVVTYRTMLPVGGIWPAICATAFVIAKQFYVVFGLITGRIRRG